MITTRRFFVFAGLACVGGFCYTKRFLVFQNWRVEADNIEAFFKKYEFEIPAEVSVGALAETDALERKLVSLLSTVGIDGTIEAVHKMIRYDYQVNKIRLINGWILSEFELNLLSVRNRYV
jgi:hypothetical protein